jgi:hypothetical protein
LLAEERLLFTKADVRLTVDGRLGPLRISLRTCFAFSSLELSDAVSIFELWSTMAFLRANLFDHWPFKALDTAPTKTDGADNDDAPDRTCHRTDSIDS